jgi:hypothetical protein
MLKTCQPTLLSPTSLASAMYYVVEGKQTPVSLSPLPSSLLLPEYLRNKPLRQYNSLTDRHISGFMRRKHMQCDRETRRDGKKCIMNVGNHFFMWNGTASRYKNSKTRSRIQYTVTENDTMAPVRAEQGWRREGLTRGEGDRAMLPMEALSSSTEGAKQLALSVGNGLILILNFLRWSSSPSDSLEEKKCSLGGLEPGGLPLKIVIF